MTEKDFYYRGQDLIIDEIKAIKDHIELQLNMERENNLKAIKQDIEDPDNGSHGYGGKYIKSHGKYYLVVAACSTIEDYYYVLVDKDRCKSFSSCVGSPGDIIDYVPAEMSIVQYLIENEPKDFAANIKRYIDSTGHDVLFTKINLSGTLY